MTFVRQIFQNRIFIATVKMIICQHSSEQDIFLLKYFCFFIKVLGIRALKGQGKGQHLKFYVGSHAIVARRP